MSAGIAVEAAFVDRASTWTATPATVDTWFPLRSESLTDDPTITRSEATGQVSQYQGKLTQRVVTGDVVAELDYNYGHGLLEFALGANSPAKTYDTADELVYCGLNFDKGTARHQFPSACFNRLQITGAPNEIVTATYGTVAYEQVSTATAFPVSRPAESLQERVYFEDVNVRLGAVIDGALSATEDVGISGFELTLENNMAVDQVDSQSDKRVLAPVRNGFRTGSLRLDFTRYQASLHAGGQHPLNTWRDSQTQLQATLVFTGSTGSYTISLPILHLTEGANHNVAGPEVLTGAATFMLEGGANANMSGMDQLRIVNA